jgi:hypothetical protein
MYSMTEADVASLDDLAAAITAGAVRLAAATASWLRLVAEFDARGGWHGVGILSCAHWLAWQCGMGPGAAREHVRVARALRSLPLIDTAFTAGRLSYSKVRALTRIAGPDCEESLLEFAMSATASQTERFCRAWRRVDDEDAGRRNSEEEVRFDYETDDEGFFTLTVRGPVEQGAPLMAAVESLAEREARRERAQAKQARAGHETIRAAGGAVDDALVRRCADAESIGAVRERTAARRLAALASLAEARPDMDRRPGDPPRREVVLHVDVPVLADDTAAGRAHYEGGPAITGAQARRVLCEGTVIAMLEDGREPLAVGRRRRRATKAQRRALLRRDGGCARPGCPETRIERLHAHHLRHWLFGGRTDLHNLVLLCDADHGLVHDLDLVMARRDGRLIVTAPDGRRVWGTADAAFVRGAYGLDRDHTGSTALAGVPPFDTTVGRRPAALSRAGHNAGPDHSGGEDHRTTCVPPRRSGRRLRRSGITRETRRMSRVLFPDGAPDLPVTLQEGYDRLDLDYAIGVLMGNRDLARRLAEESGAQLTG